MSDIISLEQWKQQKAAEAIAVRCEPSQVHITWTPRLSEQDLARLRKAGQGFRDMMESFRSK
jgi:cell division inhibitor SulA